MNTTVNTAALRAPDRDPAWMGRLTWALLCVLLLWPLGVATEFKPWVLLEPDNLRISGQFIARSVATHRPGTRQHQQGQRSADMFGEAPHGLMFASHTA